MNKVLGFATSFAFAASLAFASFTLPFFAGEARAQVGDAPIIAADVGTFACGANSGDPAGDPLDCAGVEVIIDCQTDPAMVGLCGVEIPATVGTTVEIQILVDAVTGEFISLNTDPNPVEVGPQTQYLHPDVVLQPNDDRPHWTEPGGLCNPCGPGYEPLGLGMENTLGAEEAWRIEQAVADAEEAAAAKALSLQQAEEEKACRGVPLALKHLLCAAKI